MKQREKKRMMMEWMITKEDENKMSNFLLRTGLVNIYAMICILLYFHPIKSE